MFKIQTEYQISVKLPSIIEGFFLIITLDACNELDGWYIVLHVVLLVNDKNVIMPTIFITGAPQIVMATETVCPSVCLSVRLLHFFHHVALVVSSRVITIDKSDVHAKGQGQRPKVKVKEVVAPLSRFRTVTPVSIHIWR